MVEESKKSISVKKERFLSEASDDYSLADASYDVTCAYEILVFVVTGEQHQILINDDDWEDVFQLSRGVTKYEWLHSLLECVCKQDETECVIRADIEHILKYPFFWDAQRRIDFMNACIDFLREYFYATKELKNQHDIIELWRVPCKQPSFLKKLDSTNLQESLLVFFSSEFSSETEKMSRYLLEEDVESFLKIYEALRKAKDEIPNFPAELAIFYYRTPPYRLLRRARKRRHSQLSASTN